MNNKIIFTGIITTALYIVLLSPSYAEIYKWVDQNGLVHYGEQPGNTDAKKVPIRNNVTTKPRAIKKPENNGNKNTQSNSLKNQNGDNTGKQPAESKKPGISKKEKNRLCKEAKSDIAAINSRGRMREINAKGEYRYLSENERQQRLTAAKKKQREYCR
jgi:hypothetical protein